MKVPWKPDSTPENVKQERRQGKKPGARAQINSGRVWHSLRDVLQNSPVGPLLIDNKTGANGPLKSYRLTDKDFDALKRDANRTPPGCHPTLRIDLGKHRLVVIEEDVLDEILSRVK